MPLRLGAEDANPAPDKRSKQFVFLWTRTKSLIQNPASKRRVTGCKALQEPVAQMRIYGVLFTLRMRMSKGPAGDWPKSSNIPRQRKSYGQTA